jgi:hypothetical protein
MWMGRGFRETNTAEKDAMANNPGNIDWDAVREEEETKTRGFQLIGSSYFGFHNWSLQLKRDFKLHCVYQMMSLKPSQHLTILQYSAR